MWIWIELGVWMVGDMNVGVGGRYGCREGGGGGMDTWRYGIFLKWGKGKV